MCANYACRVVEMYVVGKNNTEQVEYCLTNVFSKKFSKGAHNVGLLNQFEPYVLLIMLKSILAVILIYFFVILTHVLVNVQYTRSLPTT